jgi:hypothetical protein
MHRTRNQSRSGRACRSPASAAQTPIILSLSKDGLRMRGHFDKLSANGFHFVFEFLKPIQS